MGDWISSGVGAGMAMRPSPRTAPFVILFFIIVMAALYGWRNWNEGNCERHPESERCIEWRNN